MSLSDDAVRVGRPDYDRPRLARVRAGTVRARPAVPGRAVCGSRAQSVRRPLRPAPVVLVRVRRARPAHGRREEPAREQGRRRGARLVQPDRPGRHQADGGLHRGPAQRFQRGRHQGPAGQAVRAVPGRGQAVRGLSGRRQVVRARLPRVQSVRPVGVPLVPGVRLRSGRAISTCTVSHEECNTVLHSTAAAEPTKTNTNKSVIFRNENARSKLSPLVFILLYLQIIIAS